MRALRTPTSKGEERLWVLDNSDQSQRTHTTEQDIRYGTCLASIIHKSLQACRASLRPDAQRRERWEQVFMTIGIAAIGAEGLLDTTVGNGILILLRSDLSTVIMCVAFHTSPCACEQLDPCTLRSGCSQSSAPNSARPQNATYALPPPTSFDGSMRGFLPYL